MTADRRKIRQRAAVSGRIMLKRSPSLTEQVKTFLKQRILNAEFEAGRMPSEADLANELNVSRNTVRDALGRLEMEGFITRKQGAGTFINDATHLVKTRLEEVVPYETLMREHGYTPTIKLLHTTKQPADPSLADQLKIEPEQPVLVIQKLFQANDQPVILTQTHLPTHLIKHPFSPDDLRLPIFEFLPKFCQQELAYYLSEIVPLIAPPWLVEQLALPHPLTAILSFEELIHNQNHEPVAKACSYFRDDLLRLRLIRRYHDKG
jgi:GntR family transcriptional regulator